MMQRSTIVQIVALSVALLVVTDYLEQTWLWKRLMTTTTIVSELSSHRVLVVSEQEEEEPISFFSKERDLRNSFFSTEHELRQLQEQQPPQESHVCGSNEIRNSHLELGVTGYWNPLNGNLSVVTPGFGEYNEHAIEVSNRGDLWFAGTYQTMNVSCFEAGDLLEITFRVQLEGYTDVCNPNVTEEVETICPFVILGSNHKDGSYHHERIYDTEMEWNEQGWNIFHVMYTMKERNINPQNVSDIYIMFLGGQGNLLLDNVNVRLVPCYGNIVENGNAEHGLFPWRQFGRWDYNYMSVSTIEPASGMHSFVHTNRSGNPDPVQNFHGQEQYLAVSVPKCMTVNSVWRLRAQVRLWDPATNRSTFDECELPMIENSYGNCPAFGFQNEGGGKVHAEWFFFNDEQMLSNWDPYGWNTMDIVVTLDERHTGQGYYRPRLYVYSGKNNGTNDFYVDDIQMERLVDDVETPTEAPSTTFAPTPMPTTYCTQNWANWGDEGDWTFDSEWYPRTQLSDTIVHPWGAWGGNIRLISPGYGDDGYAIELYNRPGSGNGAYFWYVDVPNCVLTENDDTWKAAAKVKLYYPDTTFPVSTCDPVNKIDCPHVKVLLKYDDDRFDWLVLHDTDMIWPTDGSWANLDIQFSIPPSQGTPDLIKFVPIFMGGPAGSVLVLDNIVFQRVDKELVPTSFPTTTLAPSPSPSVYCTKNMLHNHDFSLGNYEYWWGWSATLALVSPGYGGESYAVAATNREYTHGGLAQRIDPSCVSDGHTWRISFWSRITDDTTGLPYTTCDPSMGKGGVGTTSACPKVNLIYKTTEEPHTDKILVLYDEDMVWQSNGDWNRFDILWQPDYVFNDLTYLMFTINGGPAGHTLFLDDIQFERLEEWESPTESPSQSPMPSIGATEYCERNFAYNGDAESGNSAYWFGWGNDVGIEQGGYGGSNYALKAFNRQSWHRGVGTWIDTTCVTTNSTWHIQAKVRMYDQASGAPIGKNKCNPKNVLSNWCPLVRLITSKPKPILNTTDTTNTTNTTTTDTGTDTGTGRMLRGGNDHGGRELMGEVESDFLFETFRDTTYEWNNEGNFVEINVYLLLNPKNSGPDINSFVPYIVGGPPDSVLVVDDVSIRRTVGGEQYEEAKPPPMTCSSVGDPHLESHYGVLYDNHESGWVTLFNAEGILIETEQILLAGVGNVRFNRAWRITENGIVTGYGDNGEMPNEGIFFVMEPVTVWIHTMAFNLTNTHPFNDWMYNIFVTTSQFESDEGLCSCEIFDDIEEYGEEPVATAPTAEVTEETKAAAEEACAVVSELDAVYQGCVQDLLILGEPMTAQVTEMYSDVLSLHLDIDLQAAAVDQPEDGSTAEDELALAVQIKADTDPLVVDAATLRTALLAGEDPSASVEGDPLISGLHQQKFDFTGRTDAWYANFASEQLQWNMKFHKFDNCVGEDGMYITSMAYNIQRSSSSSSTSTNEEAPPPPPPHQILISVADESKVFPGCPNDEICLSDGSLQIHIDGEVYTQPGDYRVSDDLRIVAFNTWEACARKWYDYDEGIHKHDSYYNNAAVHRRRAQRRLKPNNNNKKNKNDPSSSSSSWWDWFSPRKRSLLSSQSPLEFIRQDREYMVKPAECSPWLEVRTAQDDLFVQQGGWAMVYIETPYARFQVQHRQVSKTREMLEGGGSGAPHDLVVEGMLFEGNQHLCQAHVLDGWLAQTSQSLRDEAPWNGILGETNVLKYHDNGDPILLNRNLILIGEDEDYEVSEPFETEFAAKEMMRRLQLLWEQDRLERRQEQQQLQQQEIDLERQQSTLSTATTTTTTATTTRDGILMSLWNLVLSCFEVFVASFHGILWR